jgi:electron transfer flavoprotein alpha subunit
LQISPPSCRTVFDPERAQSASEQQSPVQLILDAVRVAQDDDARCGQRRTEEIYCRALWLLEVLDPIVIAFDPSVSPDERLEAAASLDWALRMAVDAPTAAEEATTVEESVAPEGPNSITGEGDVLVVSVGNGFAQLRPLTSRLAEALKGVDGTSRLVAEDEEHLALLIKARAHPSILEPLSAMQTVCLLGT